MTLPKKPDVKRAGKRARASGAIGNVAAADLDVLDEWRRAHLTPLTAIAMWLRGPAKDVTGQAPAQRLKRRDTFLDKLISGRARDASTMQDLGGCRIIFKDINSLQGFRKYLKETSRARHELTHETDKYDYIATPKATGYRGVHYVYSYISRADARQEYSGLKVEVQLRTEAQHAWATAVEISDLVYGTRTKFEDGNSENGEFFKLASEIIAREYEGMTSCYADLRDIDLKSRFREIEGRVGVLDRLAKLREQGDVSRIKRHTVLAFMQDDTVEIYGYDKAQRAIERERILLLDDGCANVVYVSASTPNSIRNSYRNYLTNPADFVNLLKDVLR